MKRIWRRLAKDIPANSSWRCECERKRPQPSNGLPSGLSRHGEVKTIADGQLDARQLSAIVAPEEIEMTADGKYYKTRTLSLDTNVQCSMSPDTNVVK
jgi:hypothetical protein